MDARYDGHTALLVVDVQNDFADPKGSLAVLDGAGVVPVANAEIDAARAAGALVVYTADWHPERTPHFATDGGAWPAHCVAGTWGAAFHPDLAVDGPVVRKGVGGEDGYSGFSTRDPGTGEQGRTDLADLLHDRGITRVVICGLATDYCVRATALDALEEGFEVGVIASGVRAVDVADGDGDRALDAVRVAGGRIL